MNTCDIGVIGLAVMGQNLALNMDEKGFGVAVFNRTVSKMDTFMQDGASGTNIKGCHTIEEFIQTLKRPRKILLMVKSGAPVDAFIETLMPHLSKGDIIIDGGNSDFEDTNRRCSELKQKGILYVGAGISGGEEGARHGPSIMPGGNEEAWPHIKEILQAISAKANGSTPCCDWVGPMGAGHFVKMVHNGIEYGDIQLIAEAYDIMKRGLGLSNEVMSSHFTKWNKGVLNSYLIEITSQILSFKNEQNEYVVDTILDVAGQKGTGRWTAINALNLGSPLTLITEAVFARALSAKKEERLKAFHAFSEERAPWKEDSSFLEFLEKGLYAAKIMSYAQGFMLLKEASKTFKWNLHLGAIALMWRAGCIIRSSFLDNINTAYASNPSLDNLLLDPFFQEQIKQSATFLRQLVSKAILGEIPIPCMSSALAFFDGYRSKNLPQNLLQAQRDFFGAHTYERVDRKRGEFFHTHWLKTSGAMSATSYNA